MVDSGDINSNTLRMCLKIVADVHYTIEDEEWVVSDLFDGDVEIDKESLLVFFTSPLWVTLQGNSRHFLTVSHHIGNK